MAIPDFVSMIQSLFDICFEARIEKGVDPGNMALAMIGAGRDVLIAEGGPEIAAAALLAALDALRSEHPDEVRQVEALPVVRASMGLNS